MSYIEPTNVSVSDQHFLIKCTDNQKIFLKRLILTPQKVLDGPELDFVETFTSMKVSGSHFTRKVVGDVEVLQELVKRGIFDLVHVHPNKVVTPTRLGMLLCLYHFNGLRFVYRSEYDQLAQQDTDLTMIGPLLHSKDFSHFSQYVASKTLLLCRDVDGGVEVYLSLITNGKAEPSSSPDASAVNCAPEHRSVDQILTSKHTHYSSPTMRYPEALVVAFFNDGPAPNPLSNKYMLVSVAPQHREMFCSHVQGPKGSLPEAEYEFLKWHFETMGGYDIYMGDVSQEQLTTIQYLITKGFFAWSDYRKNVYERTVRPTQIGRLAQLYHFTPNRLVRKPEYEGFESGEFAPHIDLVLNLDLGSSLVDYIVSKTELKCQPVASGVCVSLEPIKTLYQLDKDEMATLKDAAEKMFLESQVEAFDAVKNIRERIMRDAQQDPTLQAFRTLSQNRLPTFIDESLEMRKAAKATVLSKLPSDMKLQLRELQVSALEASIEALDIVVNEALEPLYESLTVKEKDALAFASNVKNIPADLPQCLDSYYCFFPKELWDGKTLRGIFWKQELPGLFALKLIETAPTSDSMYRLTKLGRLLLNGLPTEERSSPFLVARRMTTEERKHLLEFSWKLQTPREDDADSALVGCLGRLRDLALVSDYAGNLNLTDRGREVVDYLLANRPDEGQAGE